MKNISGQYQELLEGKMTQAQFLRNARAMFPNYVTNHNSFDDSVKILKTKGMLVEGDAVKGTPDKAPEYDYPTQPGKYKKVVQEPEVDEQDGIYPATTLTDIPKEEVSKPVKSKTRPDGLEDIKNNDTKNEMKKVKVVKENISPEALKGAEKEITKNDASIQTMADKLGISQEELFKMLLKKLGGLKEYNSYDDVHDRYDKYDDIDENQRSFDDVFGDFIETDDATEIKAYLKAKGKEAISKIKAKLPQLKDQARTKLAKLMKIELDEARSKKTPNKELDIRERLKPAITKLVQEVLDEMGTDE
jgi:hypothetical protein